MFSVNPVVHLPYYGKPRPETSKLLTPPLKKIKIRACAASIQFERTRKHFIPLSRGILYRTIVFLRLVEFPGKQKAELKTDSKIKAAQS